MKRGKKGREKYTVLEKLNIGVKDGYIAYSRIILEKSSFENAIGFMDIIVKEDPKDISVNCYAFIHSCTHDLFAPGKILLYPEDTKNENAPSNKFEYSIISKKISNFKLPEELPKKIKNKAIDLQVVESSFDYPSTYSGPRYKKRLVVFAKGIGIIFCKVEYDHLVDNFILRKYKVNNGENFWFPVNETKNWWEYEISYEYGPNDLNILSS